MSDDFTNIGIQISNSAEDIDMNNSRNTRGYSISTGILHDISIKSESMDENIVIFLKETGTQTDEQVEYINNVLSRKQLFCIGVISMIIAAGFTTLMVIFIDR